MTHFIELLDRVNAPELAKDFAAVAARSLFRLWKPGDPIATDGTRVLLGVGPWNGNDMMLLDVLIEMSASATKTEPLLELFNADDCLDQKAFANYVPGVAPVLQMPVAGLWSNGKLQWRGQGYAARDRVAHLFGSSSDAVVRRLDEWRKARSLKSTG